MDDFATAVGLLVDFLQILAGVVGAVLLSTRVRPPARAAAVLGCLLLAGSAAVSATYRLLVPLLLKADVDLTSLSIVVIVGYGLPAVAGIAVLVRALVLASRSGPPTNPSYPPPAPPQGYLHPPYPQRPPYPPPDQARQSRSDGS